MNNWIVILSERFKNCITRDVLTIPGFWTVSPLGTSILTYRDRRLFLFPLLFGATVDTFRSSTRADSGQGGTTEGASRNLDAWPALCYRAALRRTVARVATITRRQWPGMQKEISHRCFLENWRQQILKPSWHAWAHISEADTFPTCGARAVPYINTLRKKNNR